MTIILPSVTVKASPNSLVTETLSSTSKSVYDTKFHYHLLPTSPSLPLTLSLSLMALHAHLQPSPSIRPREPSHQCPPVVPVLVLNTVLFASFKLRFSTIFCFGFYVSLPVWDQWRLTDYPGIKCFPSVCYFETLTGARSTEQSLIYCKNHLSTLLLLVFT